MQKTTTNKSASTGKSSIYTLLTATVFALATLPALSFADQPAAPESSFNSSNMRTDVAENYGDINDEEDVAVDESDAEAVTVSMQSPSTSLMLAANDGGSDIDDGAYGDNQDEG